MKKLLLVLVLAVAGVYGLGMISFSESSVRRLIDESDRLSAAGQSAELCERMTDDMQMEVIDHTAGRDGNFKKGKDEICALYRVTAPAIALLQKASTIERRDLKIQRQWLRPLTANVTYVEFATISLPRQQIHRATESDVEITLVMTLGGVKIKHEKMEIFAQEK